MFLTPLWTKKLAVIYTIHQTISKSPWDLNFYAKETFHDNDCNEKDNIVKFRPDINLSTR